MQWRWEATDFVEYFYSALWRAARFLISFGARRTSQVIIGIVSRLAALCAAGQGVSEVSDGFDVATIVRMRRGFGVRPLGPLENNLDVEVVACNPQIHTPTLTKMIVSQI